MQPSTEQSAQLFDNCIDPIETSIRERFRTFIEEMIVKMKREKFGALPLSLRRHPVVSDELARTCPSYGFGAHVDQADRIGIAAARADYGASGKLVSDSSHEVVALVGFQTCTRVRRDVADMASPPRTTEVGQRNSEPHRPQAVRRHPRGCRAKRR
jgi:hypothetical protein